MDYSQPPEKIRSPAEVGSSALVIGLCGASNSGKTTLAQKLLDQYQYVTLIHQDDFYKVNFLVALANNCIIIA